VLLSLPIRRRVGLGDRIVSLAEVNSILFMKRLLLERGTYSRGPRGGTSLGHLLPLQVVRKCQDPRDKVFSILGLVDERIRQQLHVDYSKSTQFVYALAVKVDIEIHQELGILRWNMPLKDESPYPSCCPKWDQGLIRNGHTPIGTKAPGYTASSGERSSSRFSDDLKVVFLKGFKIGEVDEICVQNSEERFSWSEDEAGRKVSKSAESP
jgi:hypothetical protein